MISVFVVAVADAGPRDSTVGACYITLLKTTNFPPSCRYMLVRYEDLVTSPAATLQSVYFYLELPWTHHVR